MKNIARIFAFVAFVALLVMVAGIVSLSLIPSELNEGIATIHEVEATAYAGLWALWGGFLTAAIAGIGWVFTRPFTRLEMQHPAH